MNRNERRRQEKMAHKKARGGAGILQKALSEYQAGKFQGAQKKCATVLKAQPENADANHLMGLCAYRLREFENAETYILRALDQVPGHADMFNNLGHVLKDVGRREEALEAYQKSLSLDPAKAETHSNLAETLLLLGRIEAALKHFDSALSLDPDNIAILTGYGNALINQKKFPQAVNCLRRVIELEPGFAGGYVNLGNALKEKGELSDAAELYKLAIELNPGLVEAFLNLAYAQSFLGQQDEALTSLAEAIRIAPQMEQGWFDLACISKLGMYQDGDRDIASRIARLPEGISGKPDMAMDLALLAWSLAADLGSGAAQDYFTKAQANLPSLASQTLPSRKPASGEALSLRDPVALLHFGRSGTGLMHSLIDGHPQVTTLPSIYTKGYFERGVWDDLISQGRKNLPERFTQLFKVLFDAADPSPVPGLMNEDTSMLGVKEGMTRVGQNHDEKLSVDRDAFCAEVNRLMDQQGDIDAGSFFRIVFQAYEAALGNDKIDPLPFYHIHDPGLFARANFLRYFPNARLMMMVREPLQSCESWIREDFKAGEYGSVAEKIAIMLYDIDRPEFSQVDNIGLKLEDLKARPEGTIQGLCTWLGINESPSLYEMTAQGKMWWGDPTSADFNQDKPMPPFDDACVVRTVGSIFSERDQLVLSTLYYPFRARFAYVEENAKGFESDLKAVRPMLDELFDFEKSLLERVGQDKKTFKQRRDYHLLRARLIYRWNLLDQKGGYPGMLKPL